MPRVTADLTAGDVALDPFLGPATTGVEQAKQAGRVDPGARRWSRSRMDLGWLTGYAGDIELKADRLSVRGYDFRDPDIKLLLDKGTVTMRQFTGKLFGGSLDLRAVLRAQAYARSFDDLQPVERVGRGCAGDDGRGERATGTFSANGSISTNGNSQIEMISDTTGSATVKAQNGVLTASISGASRRARQDLHDGRHHQAAGRGHHAGRDALQVDSGDLEPR